MIWAAVETTTVATIAPTGTVVSVEMNRPTALRPSIDTVTYAASSTHRHRYSAMLMVSPDRSVTGPIGKSGDHDDGRSHDAERGRADVLDGEQSHPPGWRNEQVAERAEVGFSRDGVAGDDADGQRQEQRDSEGEPREGDEQPVLRDRVKERGPATCGAVRR